MSGDHRPKTDGGVSPESQTEDADLGRIRETITFDSGLFNTKGSIFETIEFQPIVLDLNNSDDQGNLPTK